MDFENIEKIIEYSKNKVGIIIVVLAGIFVPGILTIFLFCSGAPPLFPTAF